MRVSDVLQIGKSYKTYVIAGKEGLHRQITSIEVMEVPDLANWMTEGAFFITTFYSVKDNVEAQINVMKDIIEKKGAGIMIKLGRFIDVLPERFIQLADEHQIPVFILPKEVSYISILTPLYARLHMNEITHLPKSAHPLYEIEAKSYLHMEELINDLADKLKCTIFIEDMHGRLLVHSRRVQSDDWRKDFLLFSKPHHEKAEETLEKWRMELMESSAVHHMEKGMRHRVILPFIEKNRQVAYIHFLSSSHEEQHLFHPTAIKMIQNKIFTTWMSELNEIQQQRLQDLTLFHIKKNPAPHYILLYLERGLNGHILEEHASFIYYMCIYRKYLAYSMEKFSNQSYSIIEYGEKVFVLLPVAKGNMLETQPIEERLAKAFAKTMIADVRIAISNRFSNLDDLEKQKEFTEKTLSIGTSLFPDKPVVSYHELGIYMFLLPLSRQENVRQYAEGLLTPLLNVDHHLLETLNVYMEENRNVSHTAQRLFVNRRTINYRLQRIQQELQMDLNDAETLFVLQFCLKIWNLTK